MQCTQGAVEQGEKSLITLRYSSLRIQGLFTPAGGVCASTESIAFLLEEFDKICYDPFYTPSALR